ncbi:hypothetical protein DY000_02052881 [Brassica cretica]|uniref:Uncharacterized protein n=1 Tax=Brassica cretica TaxID=69181 RepID=A0ABQ7ABM1_BRACR|nr:hypothetical protein DY000_02052881 [Brassica cretica]
MTTPTHVSRIVFDLILSRFKVRDMFSAYVTWATLPVRRAELVDAKGNFDQILAGLKSECILPSCLGEPEGQDPVAKDGGESAPMIPEGAIGDGESPPAEDD